jgi:alpha-maltose-1-phosphate synthase
MTLRIAGVIDEDPFDPQTWSGLSAYFFGALRENGVLSGAVSATPAKPVQRLYQLLSFQSDKQKWKFRYHLNVNYYRQMTRVARQKLTALGTEAFDVILQVGAWYDMTNFAGKPVISYHDGNLATLLQSPYGYPSIAVRHIRSTLAYERELYKKIRLVFPMSEWLADSFVRDNGVNRRKVFPVGAGINLPHVRPIRNKSYEAPRILFVGKDFSRKGGPDLLAAFAKIRAAVKTAELAIVGAELDNAPPGVRCIGVLSKSNSADLNRLLDEYERASIFVMPSLYEPFGVAFAEAMAHKLPCVGTNICAMPEIITEGRSGFLVPPRDPVALASRILALLESPDLCREFGDFGYQRYLENFTWQAVVDRMLEVVTAEL